MRDDREQYNEEYVRILHRAFTDLIRGLLEGWELGLLCKVEVRRDFKGVPTDREDESVRN